MEGGETAEGWARAGRAVVQRRGEIEQRRGWANREDAARAAGVHETTWGKLERGGRISPLHAAAISRELEWPPDAIERIAAGEDPPWRTEAERATALEAQVAALAEQVTTLLARLDRLAAEVDRLSPPDR